MGMAALRLEALNNFRRLASDAFWRFVPISVVIAVTSYVLGSQLIRPQHRTIKAGVLLIFLAILLRFEMVYAIYFFIVLFPFPSGMVLTSTNVILMTLIPLIWVARSRATGQKLVTRTEVDKWILVLIFAYFVSLFNVETTEALSWSFKMIWRQLTAVAFFYLIVRFVDDEKKLERIMKVIALSGAFVALTGVVELVSPGATLIPGWIETRKRLGATGLLGYRIGGIRLGGAIGSHDILSDYCALCVWFMVLHFLRAKNPIEKLFWMIVSALTLIVILGTANRGAILSLAAAFVYSLYVFRRYMNLTRYVTLIAVVAVFFAGAQVLLEKYTIAASVTQRIMGTEFEGLTPDTRVGVWGPVFKSALEHPLIGHGPYYDTGKGLVRVFWPHNGYLFYFHTLGLFGLSAFLVIVYRLMRRSLRYAHPLAEGTYLGLATALLNVLLVQFLVAQMRTDHQRTTDSIYMYIAWMIFALIAASANMLRKRQAEAGAAAGKAPEAAGAPEAG
jgi:hypothetical protein